MQGLIVANISNLYYIESNKKIYEATARGKFKKEEISPVVGDIVKIEITDEENAKAIETEAKNRKGIDILKKELENNMNAFSGNSGVGKSTLINAIFEEDITKEGEISKKNKRGKNTTTAIKLYKIENNTYIADTPGFSTFDISEIQSNELAKYFKEFKEHISQCEFVGCTHIKEKNCGIKKSIDDGKIEKLRYERFCKIYQELKEREEYKKW